MIFAALLESGSGIVHGANERIAGILSRRGVEFSRGGRLAVGTGLLIVSVWIATEFGLVALVARGYRLLAFMMVLVYVVPALTVGLWRAMRGGEPQTGLAT
jgi:uncharacterized membrane protein YkvI